MRLQRIDVEIAAKCTGATFRLTRYNGAKCVSGGRSLIYLGQVLNRTDNGWLTMLLPPTSCLPHELYPRACFKVNVLLLNCPVIFCISESNVEYSQKKFLVINLGQEVLSNDIRRVFFHLPVKKLDIIHNIV